MTERVRLPIDDSVGVPDHADDSTVDLFRQLARNESGDAVKILLRGLTYRQRIIIEMRFGLRDGFCYTLLQVGSVFGMTRERVRQIESKALGKLRLNCKRRGWDNQSH